MRSPLIRPALVACAVLAAAGQSVRAQDLSGNYDTPQLFRQEPLVDLPLLPTGPTGVNGLTGLPPTPAPRSLPPNRFSAAPNPLPQPTTNFAPDPLRQMDGHVRNAIGFYGRSGAAAQTLQQSAVQRPTGSVVPASATQSRGKPFQSVNYGATVSPYLNLYREENEESSPNYFAFVRPQQNQIDANRRNQAEIQRLNRQVQRAEAASGASPYRSGGIAPTGSRSRYLDTGRYYRR